MPLLVCGIDEAGYGPMLGPLCVGFVALRIRDAVLTEDTPDLWRALKAGICRKAGDRHKRIAIEDSKKLKLAKDLKTKHPLLHLERGVQAFLRCRAAVPGPPDLPAPSPPATDAELLVRLGAKLEQHPWYIGDPLAIPVALSPGEIAIAANQLAGALSGAGIDVIDLRCSLVGERAFNRTIDETGSKGETTMAAVGEHLRHAWSLADRFASGADPVEMLIACDRLGGRTRYGLRLARELQGAGVAAAEEIPERSVYRVTSRGKHARIVFMPEAETAHLTVALASMTAKYIRELAMRRFNRYWCARCPELKPTAGYTQDARRWLADMQSVLNDEERIGLVRRA